MDTAALLRVDGLRIEYPLRQGRTLQAVAGVDFSIARGESFGLVGESGCGKSSLARAVMQLPPPTSGRVAFNGVALTGLPGKELQRVRPQMQMVFQDPVASLNPRRKIGKSIGRPLRGLKGDQRLRKIYRLMMDVGLDPVRYFDRLPSQLSGGQCQRASIARALITEPQLLVCDEPVSSLDVSIQAQIINLLQNLKAAYGLALLFISHDLAVVKHICDRVAVMYHGHFCEVAPAEQLYCTPAHPYTRMLLSAVPIPDPARAIDAIDFGAGEFPVAVDPGAGCCFRNRCPRARKECGLVQPPLRDIGGGHQVACHYPQFEVGSDSVAPATQRSSVAAGEYQGQQV